MTHLVMKDNIGRIKEVKLGFSWTTFFFGWIPDILRGRFTFFVLTLFIGIFGLVTGAGELTSIVLFPFIVVYCFTRNKYVTLDLLGKGYKIVKPESRQTLERLEMELGFELSEDLFYRTKD